MVNYCILDIIILPLSSATEFKSSDTKENREILSISLLISYATVDVKFGIKKRVNGYNLHINQSAIVDFFTRRNVSVHRANKNLQAPKES